MYGLKEGEEYYPWLWPVPQNGVIGKRRVRRLDGYEKASGKAIYARDIHRPGMLFAKYLRSRYAHAKIKSMDTSKAEAFPGVRAVLRYDDPDIVWPDYRGQPVVPDTNHWYPGVIGAVVVGESEAIVDQALKLIEIDMEELPIIMDVEEALKPGAPIMRPDQNAKTNRRGRFEPLIKFGDVEAGFAQADKIIEWKATTEQDVWAGVEAMCGVAEWKGDCLEVWQHGQSSSTMMSALRAYAPYHKIHLYMPYNGAQFGGTTYLGADRCASQIAVIAARRTGCPVKFLDDESHFADGCCEDARSRYYFKVGVKLDGTITAVKLTAYEAWVTESSTVKVHEGTKIPNIYLSADYAAFTRPPSMCFKHGSSTVRVVAQLWEHVAGELGMDPTKVAEINDGCHGHDMAYINEHVKKPQGFNPSRDSFKEVHAIGKAVIDWDRKWHLPGTKILPNGNYHGLGYISTVAWSHHTGSTTTGIRINPDGTVNIVAAQHDGGWCPQTTYCQVAADELGVKYEDVRIRAYDDRGGFESRTGGGSSGMNGTHPSMIRAARKMKHLILEKAVEPTPQRRGMGAVVQARPALFPNKKPEELDINNSIVFEKANPENRKTLAQIAAIWSRNLFVWDYPPFHLGRGGVQEEYTMVKQAHFVEIEVDPDTGAIEIKKQVSVNDGGKVINPDSFNGQQYGGAYMGLGRSSKETVYHDPQTGVALNENLIGYPVNLMNDIESIECHFVETGLGYAPYGTVGIGESGGAVNHCIIPSAVYNAIGKYVDAEPVTPDKILKALGKA